MPAAAAFKGRLLLRLRASPGGAAISRIVRRSALTLLLVSLAAICGTVPVLSRSGVTDKAANRLAIGTAKLLSAPIDLAPGVLEALATKHAETLGDGDDFWPRTVDAIMETDDVREALEKRVRSDFAANRETFARLTRELPALADALAKTLQFDDQGRVDGLPVDEVLRRMRKAPLAAQRALIARAIDPSNVATDELVDRIASTPEILAETERDVLGLRSSNNPKARVLWFRYSAARRQDLTDRDLRDALRSKDRGEIHAALARISDPPPNRAASFAPELVDIVGQNGELEDWTKSLELLLTVDPGAAVTLIDRHRGDADFWLSDRGSAALGLLAAAPATLAQLRGRIAALPLTDMLASGRCEVIAPAVAIFSDVDPPRAAQLVTSLLTKVATSRNPSSCSVGGIAKALDDLTTRLGETASSTYAAALAAAATSGSEGPGAGFETALDILRASAATRRAFASDRDALVGLAVRADPHPLVAALAEALPSDDPALSLIRRTLLPKESESPTDHIQRDKKLILAALRLTARRDGWSDQDLDQLTSLSSNSADPDVAKAAFDDLSLAGHERGLVEVFDAIMRIRGAPAEGPDELSFRAIRAFARASTLSRDRAALYGRERVGWLMERFPDAGLRGWVVRALARRPEGVSVDEERFAYLLARAVASFHGDTTGACADAATLGPFSIDALAVELLDLSGKQDYQNEDWAPACVALLAPSKSTGGLTNNGETLWLLSLRDGTLEAQTQVGRQLATAADLWSESKGDPNGSLLRRRLAARAAALAPHAGWGASDVKALWDWDSELSGEFADQVWPVRKAWLLRAGLLLLIGIPSAVIVHLVFWGALLIAYRKSARIRTHVFYNPLARKILGLGYVDVMLVWIGPLRRMLFAPFTDGMLGDLGRVALGTREGPYYQSSQVNKLDLSNVAADLKEAETAALSGRLEIAREPILSGLASWRGPTCLFGPSGRGKTSYLKHILATNPPSRTPFVYLRASQCGDDLVATVCERFPGLGRDSDLVESLVDSGLLDVYVDGLNEVDRIRQEKIVQFIVGHPAANIFVTSQEVGITLPRKLTVYYLLPLTKNQMREFLLGREPVLDDNAPVRGEAYARATDAFLDRLSDEALGGEPSGSERLPDRHILTSFLATLANPMDLDTAAALLSLDIEPDPFRLREQQFRLVDEDCRAQLRRPFPIDTFSKSALEAREGGKPEIDAASFGEYVAILEQRKQVRRISVRTADSWATEYGFRHEKISDFYLHFALLDADSQKRFDLAGDGRFAGLYDYLARELPLDAANEVKEHLLSAALDSNDHRLSDRFLQHLRWRALFGRDDPPWLARYDTPESSDAVEEFDRLARLRDETESQMRTSRLIIEASRARSRILAAKDAQSLEAAVRDLFVKRGAREIPTPGGAAPLFEIPGLGSLALLCVAGQRAVTDVTRNGLKSRASRTAEAKLVVVNPQPDLDPDDRDWGRVHEWAGTLIARDIRVLETRALFRIAREEGGLDGGFWLGVMPLSGGRAGSVTDGAAP